MPTIQTDFKVPFAYSNGMLIDVDNASKGTDYKCACGEIVRLRGGDIVRNHFYHIAETKCSPESAIHKAYKDVFKTHKTIKLPHEYNGVNVLSFDRVELEKKIGNFIPDAIGYIGDDMYFIEFAKTSFISKSKLKKIKATNIFCIEVAISKTVESIDAIRHHLEKTTHNKQIVHVPMYGLERENRELKKEIKQLKKELKGINSKFTELMGNDALWWKALYNSEKVSHEYLIDEIQSTDVLFYKKKCSNGWHLFLSKNKLPNGKCIVTAFAKGNTIQLNYNLPKL